MTLVCELKLDYINFTNIKESERERNKPTQGL